MVQTPTSRLGTKCPLTTIFTGPGELTTLRSTGNTSKSKVEVVHITRFPIISEYDPGARADPLVTKRVKTDGKEKKHV